MALARKTKRVAKKRKTVAKKTVVKKKVAKKSRKAVKKKAAPKKLSSGGNPQLKAYKNLEKKLEDALEKLCKDVEKKNKKAIEKDRNDLMLLLGECSYMARECANCMGKNPKKKSR